MKQKMPRAWKILSMSNMIIYPVTKYTQVKGIFVEMPHIVAQATFDTIQNI